MSVFVAASWPGFPQCDSSWLKRGNGGGGCLVAIVFGEGPFLAVGLVCVPHQGMCVFTDRKRVKVLCFHAFFITLSCSVSQFASSVGGGGRTSPPRVKGHHTRLPLFPILPFRFFHGFRFRLSLSLPHSPQARPPPPPPPPSSPDPHPSQPSLSESRSA